MSNEIEKQISIRQARFEDIPAIARIHKNALPDDFLPSLGIEFLEKFYYPAALLSANAGSFVADCLGELAGFVTIAHATRYFTQDVLHGRYLELAKYALLSIIRNPRNIMVDLEVFWSAMIAKPSPIQGEIVFIAVDDPYRGMGIGKELVRISLSYLSEKGTAACSTKTLAENKGVIAMYENMGWRVDNHFKLIGKKYVTIIKTINK